MFMKKYLSTLVIAAMTFAITNAQAQTESSALKKTVHKAAHHKAAPIANAGDEKEPDISKWQATDFHCELGNNLTVYKNSDDDKSIALRWHTKLHSLERVGTTTGANRFENRKLGLVWIGIPAKSMLLDSNKGQQLANECKTAEQMKPASTVATTKS
jgi:hypothetical protein